MTRPLFASLSIVLSLNLLAGPIPPPEPPAITRPTPTLVTMADEPEAELEVALADAPLAELELAPEMVLRGDDPSPTATPPARSVGVFTITAFCLRGQMRNGEYVHHGAVATDRRVLPEGTRMTIDGLPGLYVSKDTGSGVIGAHVDVWMESCQDAIRWGRQYRTVEVIS